MGRKIPVTITVDLELFEKFKKVCAENDIKVSTKINTLIKEWLDKNNREVISNEK
jgi:hypothetical protein